VAQKKEALREIRSNILTRGFGLARASIKIGGLAANTFRKGDANADPAWLKRVEFLVGELGQLKGTAMKVGQTLSMYGEHLLPKEVNALLKNLQQDSPALAWPAIEKVLSKELGAERLAELDVEPDPVGAASIGQVHRAVVRSTGEVLAIKVQYPGVDKAIETDLKLLKFILNMTDMVPRGPRFDQIFEEIRVMFHQEIDYEQEAARARTFARLLADDPRYFVPAPVDRYCTRRVLATGFIDGLRIDAPEVQALPVERRNELGRAFLDLYMRELTEWQLVQTDPHLGNYMVEIGADEDRLCLFDFGAVRTVPDDFLAGYTDLIEGALVGRDSQTARGGLKIGILQPGDAGQLITDYVNLCRLLVEPFSGKAYDFGASDLPKRVAVDAGKIMTSYKLRAPPRELVFLDRKLGGVFVVLSALKCVMDGRAIILDRVGAYRTRVQSPNSISPNHA
jgi:predicted unusual protein kinase regulating ubiquinone biosynthesis (AarF/ABC1/UbiB family)